MADDGFARLTADLLVPDLFHVLKRHRDVNADHTAEDDMRHSQRQLAVAAHLGVITGETLVIRTLGSTQRMSPCGVLAASAGPGGVCAMATSAS
jgi:hypothetical protein